MELEEEEQIRRPLTRSQLKSGRGATKRFEADWAIGFQADKDPQDSQLQFGHMEMGDFSQELEKFISKRLKQRAKNELQIDAALISGFRKKKVS